MLVRNKRSNSKAYFDFIRRNARQIKTEFSKGIAGMELGKPYLISF